MFLETFSPIYRQAYDFLIAVSEPVCRPEHVHEYRITTYSLYAAASVGLRTENILKYLDRLCKTEVPIQIIKDVRACTERYGKVSMRGMEGVNRGEERGICRTAAVPMCHRYALAQMCLHAGQAGLA